MENNILKCSYTSTQSPSPFELYNMVDNFMKNIAKNGYDMTVKIGSMKPIAANGGCGAYDTLYTLSKDGASALNVKSNIKWPISSKLPAGAETFKPFLEFEFSENNVLSTDISNGLEAMLKGIEGFQKDN